MGPGIQRPFVFLMSGSLWSLFPKTYFTPHSRMSGCRWVTTPSWLSQSLRPFLHSYCCYCSVSRVQLFVTAWTAACQASLSFTISQSLLKLMSIELVIHPTISSSVIPFSSSLQPFPASGSFLMNWLFVSGGQRIGASASILPVNIQCWSPLGWTGWISLQSKGFSRVFFNITVQKH